MTKGSLPLFKLAARYLMQNPILGYLQIWNMSFGLLGMRFGWGLRVANMSTLCECLGAKPDQIPALWLDAPGTNEAATPDNTGTAPIF